MFRVPKGPLRAGAGGNASRAQTALLVAPEGFHPHPSLRASTMGSPRWSSARGAGGVRRACLRWLGSYGAPSLCHDRSPVYARTRPRITVLPVQPGDPPFRILEVDGEMVG